jgi:hypothetical protein
MALLLQALTCSLTVLDHLYAFKLLAVLIQQEFLSDSIKLILLLFQVKAMAVLSGKAMTLRVLAFVGIYVATLRALVESLVFELPLKEPELQDQ